MKNLLIKISSLIICVMCAVTAHAFADFTDMPQDEATRGAMERAVSNGLLTGYETGEIKPYGNITRAEMAAILTRAFGGEDEADISGFGDMSKDKWYYSVMSKAVAMEIFQGDGKNLNPETNITFQEAFAVVSRLFYLQAKYDIDKINYNLGHSETFPVKEYPELDGYKDKDLVASWAIPTTAAVIGGGYWAPESMTIRPTEYITRSEFAILMDNLVKTYINEPGTYDSLPAGNVVVRSNDVIINTFKGDYDIFVGDAVSGNVTLSDTVDVDRLVTRNGNVSISGIFNQVRMDGHKGCIILSGKPTVKIVIDSKYKDETFISLGTINLN